MKREESEYAIKCSSHYGPVFGKDSNSDIFICDRCNEKKCYINNDGTHGYNCNKTYQKSLFVDTAGADEANVFTVSDYEVYAYDDDDNDNDDDDDNDNDDDDDDDDDDDNNNNDNPFNNIFGDNDDW